MYGYIYKVTNTINNKIYIGKKNSDEFIKAYFGSGLLIKRAIKKYGIDNFKVELIDMADDLKELNFKEKYYIKKFNSYYKNEIGYNIASGGDGGNLIQGYNEEMYKSHIELCKINNSGIKNPNYGNGAKIKGEKNPSKRPEVKEKLSKKLSGINNPMYSMTGEKHPLYGTHLSNETKQKISESLKGKKYNCICKKCGEKFIGNSSNCKYCLKCKTIPR